MSMPGLRPLKVNNGDVDECVTAYITAQPVQESSQISLASLISRLSAAALLCLCSVQNPWDRGHGPVNISFSEVAIATLHLDPEIYSRKNTSIIYWQVSCDYKDNS